MELDTLKMDSVHKVFKTATSMMEKERKAHKIFGDLLLSLIHKFTPQIAELAEELRYEVLQDALIAWMIHSDSDRLTMKMIEQNTTIFCMLERPVKREFFHMMKKMPRFRKKRYHDMHKGIMRDHLGVYEVIPT